MTMIQWPNKRKVTKGSPSNAVPESPQKDMQQEVQERDHEPMLKVHLLDSNRENPLSVQVAEISGYHDPQV